MIRTTFATLASPIAARSTPAAVGLLLAAVSAAPAAAQVHPPEVRRVTPIGGSAGLTTRVTIFGISFRNAAKIIFDQPGIAARIVGPDFSKLPPPTIDNDNASSLSADFTVDRTAPHDLYSFRVISDAGVSSPGRWMVGRELPQIEEKEPNNGIAHAQSVSLPISINGTISEPADVDTFAVDLEAGKPFVAEVVAAQAGSPLDSLLVLQEADGTEVAHNDDFSGPDSLLIYTPKRSGRYFVSISSSVGTGDAAHAYRISLGALPVLTGTMPATLPRGRTVPVRAIGVNVPATFSAALPADWRYGLAHIFCPDGVSSNGIIVGVSDLPLVLSEEPHPDAAHALAVPVPAAVNGRFYLPGGQSGEAAAFYKIHPAAGQRLFIDVQCQDRSGARADPLLSLYDTNGKLLEESDDSLGRDSHIDRTFAAAGDYTLRVRNLAGSNAQDLVYQLLIQPPPPPGFTLTADTRARAVGQGGSAAFEVTVNRDRWNGPVSLTAADLPAGVAASTVEVPAGLTRGLVVLTAESGATPGGFPLHIVGTGMVNGHRVSQMLTRAMDRIWDGGPMTLQPGPVDTLFFAVTPPLEVAAHTEARAIEMAAGASARLHVQFQRRPGFERPFTLNALGLPDGVTAVPQPISPTAVEADLEIRAAATARPGVYTIVADAVTTNSPQVLLDRVSEPITLTITAAKSALRSPATRAQLSKR